MKATLILPGDPLTMNELIRLAKAGRAGKARGIAYVIAAEIDRWRDLAYTVTLREMRLGLKPMPLPVTVACTHLRVDDGVIDTMAPALACKAAIDGVVRAKLLQGDRDTQLIHTGFPPHQIAPFEGIRLVFRTVPGAATQDPLE